MRPRNLAVLDFRTEWIFIRENDLRLFLIIVNLLERSSAILTDRWYFCRSFCRIFKRSLASVGHSELSPAFCRISLFATFFEWAYDILLFLEN